MTGRRKPKPAANGILDRLASEEANAVLRQLWEKHSELRPEAERIAVGLLSSQSVEDIAAAVSEALINVGLEALNGRAGKHAWGYTEPGEAAMELLEEAIEDRVEDMKRHVDVDMAASAQAVCAGIVSGLYACRKTNSDGALGWAPDFPAEHAGFIVQEFLGLSRYKMTSAEREKFIESLVGYAPEWEDMFRKALSAQSKRRDM
jgi:hypothetical protein